MLVGLLVAEHPGGHDHQVDVAEPVEDLVGEGRVAAGVGGVEGHRFDHVGTGRLASSAAVGEPGPLPPGQHHRPAPAGDQPGHDGLGDLGGSSEHEHGLGSPDGVDHDGGSVLSREWAAAWAGTPRSGPVRRVRAPVGGLPSGRQRRRTPVVVAQPEPSTEVGAQDPVGVDPVPHRLPLVDAAGYMARKAAGETRESLAR